MVQKEKIYSQFGIKFWIISASVIIVIAGLREAAGLITPLFLSVFITAVFYGPFKWLQNKGLKTPLSLIIIMLGIALITVSIFGLIGASVSSFMGKIPFYQERFNVYWKEFDYMFNNSKWITLNLNFSEYVNPGIIMKLAGNVFTGFGNLMSNFFMILLVVIFMLLEISIFERKMHLINKTRWAELIILLKI